LWPVGSAWELPWARGARGAEGTGTRVELEHGLLERDGDKAQEGK
jgi:hypothetical protein